MFGLNVEHAKPGGRKRRSKAVEQPSKTTLWLKVAPPDAGILCDEHDLLRPLANELRYFNMNSFVGKAVIAATNKGDRTRMSRSDCSHRISSHIHLGLHSTAAD